jgi:hypothetical protein
MPVGRVEIEPGGRITILAVEAQVKPDNAFDRWKAGRDASAS